MTQPEELSESAPAGAAPSVLRSTNAALDADGDENATSLALAAGFIAGESLVAVLVAALVAAHLLQPG